MSGGKGVGRPFWASLWGEQKADGGVARRLGGGSQTCADLNRFIGQIKPFGIPPMRRDTINGVAIADTLSH